MTIPETPVTSSTPGTTLTPRASRGRAIGCLLSLLVLSAGAAALVLLVRTRPKPAQAPPPDRAVPVEVVTLRAGPERVRVRAQGTVTPAQRVIVQPEVAGRVVWQHPELVLGGRVAKGEVLFRVDPRDYRAALEQQKAQLANSELQLEQEQGRRVVAEREWGLLKSEQQPDGGAGKALALREPQLATAKASVQAAQSALAQAELNVARTTVVAPFNGLVQAENVEVGQLVTPQSQVATLVGTDAFWVQVSIPVDQLAWIRVPQTPGDEGSPARVSQQIGGQLVERSGRVLRLLGELDPVGRMARILVELAEPLGPAPKKGKRAATDAGIPPGPSLPLLLGAFVNVEIEGAALPGVLELPRRALREGERVYVLRDGALSIVAVQILWRTEQTVFVKGELQEGESAIVSPLRAPAPGMPVRALAAEGGAP
jgi:RND family efflux transporter MFP subunit